jgi:hypothetical protein
MFTNKNDKMLKQSRKEIILSSATYGSFDGLEISANANSKGSVTFSSNMGTRKFNINELNDDPVIEKLGKQENYLIFGKGTCIYGPQRNKKIPLPELFTPPVPANAISLPDNWQKKQPRLLLDFAEPQKAPINTRRVSAGDGKLYLQIFSDNCDLIGDVNVKLNDTLLKSTKITNGSFYISLKPAINKIRILISTPASKKIESFTVPTTLVEVRGKKIYVNGEPFLLKGTLPRNLNDHDAAYLKDLSINVIRGRQAVKNAQKYGFMAIASIQGKVGKVVRKEVSPTLEDFKKKVDLYLQQMKNNGLEAAASPYTLITQLGNEQAEGNDPWSVSLKKVDQFERLDYLLAKAWNLIKPMSPTIPLGYANHALGYIAPDFLDVYMHNSYMNKDRYLIPMKDYIKWQKCDNRPFVNTEWGANRYTPQAYHGAKNSPVLEKIHAWNYPHRWKTYIDHGTVGGTNYCLYDLDKPRDQGNSNFGILTYDRKPKLACWDIWHMWRDFELVPQTTENGKSLSIKYARDYFARNCKLILDFGNTRKTIELDDFPPNSTRDIALDENCKTFHWRMTYTTHQGLTMRSTGAWPVSVEENDFLNSIKQRETAGFLTELFDAQVVTIRNKTAPPTLMDMIEDQKVIPVAFRKPNGTVYITAFSRAEKEGQMFVTADIKTSFKGNVQAVDEWTAKPLNTKVKYTQSHTGIILKDVKIPCIAGAIGKRSDVPFDMPVFKITPNN